MNPRVFQSDVLQFKNVFFLLHQFSRPNVVVAFQEIKKKINNLNSRENKQIHFNYFCVFKKF